MFFARLSVLLLRGKFLFTGSHFHKELLAFEELKYGKILSKTLCVGERNI